MKLPNGPVDLPIDIVGGIIKAYKFDRRRSLKNFQYVVDYLQNNDIHMPCIQLAQLFKYYSNIMNIIYCKETCIAMRVNPVTQFIDIAHDLRELLNL